LLVHVVDLKCFFLTSDEMAKHTPRDVETPGSIRSVGSPVSPVSPGLALTHPDVDESYGDIAVSPIKRAATEPNVRNPATLKEEDMEGQGKQRKSPADRSIDISAKLSRPKSNSRNSSNNDISGMRDSPNTTEQNPTTTAVVEDSTSTTPEHASETGDSTHSMLSQPSPKSSSISSTAETGDNKSEKSAAGAGVKQKKLKTVVSTQTMEELLGIDGINDDEGN
jgi:hypothetical protein